MPKGGFRPGAGAPLGNKNRAKKRLDMPGPTETGPRPKFKTGRDFALWVLNAPDAEAPIEIKVRAMQALVAAEGKAASASEKPAPTPPGEVAGGLYAPRSGLAVVKGGKG